MSKTITVRLDDEVYELFKKAAEGDRRSISNYVEYATLSYITTESYVSDEEMNEILSDSELVKSLKNGLKDVKQGKYKIVPRF
ncbi:MAG: CopG family transcriptional regulator [Spirochaetia bacterium]|nr:CopG family transcriptional regulator [Spirochaetia bacterium]